MFAARLFRINDEVKLHMYCVLQAERYRDTADSIVEENSSVFSVI